MSDAPKVVAPELADVAGEVPPPSTHSDGLELRASAFESSEAIVDQIEMIGEEAAAKMRPQKPSEVTAGMRYLHISRTIHQLVTDRNRAVGLYLAVATILFTGSSALLNVDKDVDTIISLATIKRCALPFTFGALAGLSLFVAFLLIRTRVGLIYEAAKMNVLLGLPIGRVSRVNPLSIFFIMHAFVSVAGGVSAGLFAGFMLKWGGLPDGSLALPATLIGLAVTGLLLLLYIWTVKYTTSDEKLRALEK